jgi:hypothetical protein
MPTSNFNKGKIIFSFSTFVVQFCKKWSDRGWSLILFKVHSHLMLNQCQMKI